MLIPLNFISASYFPNLYNILLKIQPTNIKGLFSEGDLSIQVKSRRRRIKSVISAFRFITALIKDYRYRPQQVTYIYPTTTNKLIKRKKRYQNKFSWHFSLYSIAANLLLSFFLTNFYYHNSKLFVNGVSCNSDQLLFIFKEFNAFRFNEFYSTKDAINWNYKLYFIITQPHAPLIYSRYHINTLKD